MPDVNLDLFQDLKARGLIKQVTSPDLETLTSREPLCVYAGFDPSSDSLHIGHLLPLLTLKRFQMAGHPVIAVVGGATGMVGDPSFKNEERTLLSGELIQKNGEGIKNVISHFLDLTGDNRALILNNADWFQNISFIDFIRDVGKHFTINHMMAKDSVRTRLEDREHGISYTEFSYMLMQAYDFYILNKKYNCQLQIGGSDQWGNITEGLELIRKMGSQSGAYGFTQPLLTKSDGSKFGKTESGSVWLSSDKTSVYQFYQFWIQTEDSQVITLLKFFTFLPLEKIAELEESLKKEPEKRSAQKTLAEALTLLVHGKDELEKVGKASQALFGTEIKSLDAKTLLEVFADTPSMKKNLADLTSGMGLIELLIETGLVSSKGMARKEITAGGIYLNNERVSEPNILVMPKDLIAQNFLVLRKGKKNYALVQFV